MAVYRQKIDAVVAEWSSAASGRRRDENTTGGQRPCAPTGRQRAPRCSYPTDPFQLLLDLQLPAGITGNWRAMQHLPAAREAINRYLLAQASATNK